MSLGNSLPGYAGKILHLKLDDLSYETIPMDDYVQWGGGHGLGAALFWDYCKDKTITNGLDKENVVVLTTSPLCGTSSPSAGGRCEVVGVGYGMVPINWMTRSNFGGRFSAMMKYSGWDAVVISGQAPYPVWVEVKNDAIRYHKAEKLMGKGTQDTQKMIMHALDTGGNGWGWEPLPSKSKGMEYTTQKPAVLCIGPAGENKTAFGCLVHDAGNGAGQGGFGAVWGAKNLKAVSFLGTGSVKIADPMALVEARFKVKERYAPDMDNLDLGQWGNLGRAPGIAFAGLPTDQGRAQGCAGCVMGCRNRFDVGYGNEASCQETAWYGPFAARYAKGDKLKTAQIVMQSADFCNDLGMNSYPFMHGVHWLEHLFHDGLLGKGKKIESTLDFEKIGSVEFAKQLLENIAFVKDIGVDLQEGFVPVAHKWDRGDDLKSGVLPFPNWGMSEHGYDPRTEVEWGYASLMTDRDINSHDFNSLFWMPTLAVTYGTQPRIDADKVANLVADKLKPYVEGPSCVDYSEKNIYSDEVLNLTRWFIHYGRFWKNSALFCDLRWADLFDTNAPGDVGATADPDVGEQVYWNAVTGQNISFQDGLDMGRRIFILDRAIWAMQGRTREVEVFEDYIYEVKTDKAEFFPFFFWPATDDNGIWGYRDLLGRHLERDKMEEWKTRFYTAEGLNPESGIPTRKTLESLGLSHVADALEDIKKLGKEV